jgi:ubiquinone biosynthesis protein UbiJ
MELDDMFCQWDEYKQEQENFITQTLQKEKQKWADELRMEEKHSFPEPIDLKYYEQGFNKAVQKFNARIEKLIRNKDKSL